MNLYLLKKKTFTKKHFCMLGNCVCLFCHLHQQVQLHYFFFFLKFGGFMGFLENSADPDEMASSGAS